MRRRPFRLVPAEVSHETVEALGQLLDQARRGEIIGIAYAVMCKGRDYFVDAAGEAHRSPTFARGMVSELNDALGRRARGE
ncbi:MAG: hypothetical protein LT106_18765 [Burkholderiaceae bacterium]|nr:hypothetical protein [Burkholderiaceae bacterium]